MSTSLLASVLDPSLFVPDLRTRRKESVLGEMIARAHLAGAVRLPELLRETLVLRERAGSTGVGKGVAVPHARSLSVSEPHLVVARSRRGLAWTPGDPQPVTLVLLALSPAEVPAEGHLDFVARVVGATRLQRNRQKLLEAESFDAVAAVLREVVA